MTHTNMLNGLLSDCEPFRAWLEDWFKLAAVEAEDRWWVRDLASAAWDAGVRCAFEIHQTRDEMRETAEALDKLREVTERTDKEPCECKIYKEEVAHD
jgi:hypothetical protein